MKRALLRIFGLLELVKAFLLTNWVIFWQNMGVVRRQDNRVQVKLNPGEEFGDVALEGHVWSDKAFDAHVARLLTEVVLQVALETSED